MTPAPSLHELITAVQQDSPTDDPLDLLATASTTVTSLSTVGDAVLDHFVAGARSQGRSWAEISSVLGVSKQAAHKRFAPTTAETDMLSLSVNVADFSRFTDRARRTVAAAPEIAKGWGHNFVGTEHLLAAQFSEPQAVAARVLDQHGLSKDVVERAIQAIVPTKDPVTDESRPPFTPRAKGVLAGALREALTLGHNYIGTEHLLLGLYHQPEGVAAKVLIDGGLTAGQAKADVVAILATLMKQPPNVADD
jgi:hypothetical protein